MKMKKSAQMSLAAVISASLMLVLLGITLTVGQDIQNEMREGVDNTGYTYNASIDSSEGIDKVTADIVAGNMKFDE